MLGFEPVPKQVCGVEFDDIQGVAHTCVRAASWTGMHFHRDTQVRWFSWPFIGWIYYQPLRKRCPECGKKRADITTDTDPYVQQLEGTDVLMTACGDCFERASAES